MFFSIRFIRRATSMFIQFRFCIYHNLKPKKSRELPDCIIYLWIQFHHRWFEVLIRISSKGVKFVLKSTICISNTFCRLKDIIAIYSYEIHTTFRNIARARRASAISLKWSMNWVSPSMILIGKCRTRCARSAFSMSYRHRINIAILSISQWYFARIFKTRISFLFNIEN